MSNKITFNGYENDSRYLFVPNIQGRANLGFGTYPSTGIESCAGCSSVGTIESEQLPTTQQSVPVQEKPWWFWPAIGFGIGAAVYMVHKSGILSNPSGSPLKDAQNIQRAAAIAVQTNVPVILWGAPGIGKTSWLEALGRIIVDERGRPAKLFTVIGSTKDPTDISGALLPSGDLVPPDWAKEIQERSMNGLRSILFLDEFTSMSPTLHAALLRVVQEKVAGDCVMDPTNDRVSVICAANPKESGAFAQDLPAPAANRILHLDWPTPSVLSYALGLAIGWPTPKLYKQLPYNWKQNEEAIRAREQIGSFLRVREEAILLVPTTDIERSRAWPSPRSWEMAADVLGAARVVGASTDVQAILVQACVGVGAGGEFVGWLENLNLPDPEEVLRDPTSWNPTEEDLKKSGVLYAGCNSVSHALARKPTEERWKNAWAFMHYMFDNYARQDELVMMAYDLMKIKRDTEAAGVKLSAPAKEHIQAMKPILVAAGVLPQTSMSSSKGIIKIAPKKK